MVPAAFQAFFTASVAASSALIGLLFVSVSIAPERVFGPQSEAVRQARAVSAFTALANVFFLSMTSLVPGVNVGLVATVTGVVAATQTLFLLSFLRHWMVEGALVRSLILFVGSAAIYTGEIWLGISLWKHPTNTSILTGLLELVLGAYAVGLGRAWELLGAPRIGFISGVLDILSSRVDRARKKS